MKPSNASMRENAIRWFRRSDRAQAALRPGQLLGRRVGENAIARVHAHNGRLPRARLVLVDGVGEGGDDDQIAGLRVVSGRAVDADQARAGRSLERVRLEAAAV